MIPNGINNDIEFKNYPSRTYGLDGGMIDGLDALRQSIYKILRTERFQFGAYTPNYGIETYDLYGADPDYVDVELKRRITESLMQDDRINDVDDFKIEKNNGKVYVTFMVHSNIGKVEESYDF